MTRTEARQKLAAAFPGKSFCVQLDDWHHVSGKDDVIFQVSVLPGWDGTECSQVRCPTLEKAVEEALKMPQPPPPPDLAKIAAEADSFFGDDEKAATLAELDKQFAELPVEKPAKCPACDAEPCECLAGPIDPKQAEYDRYRAAGCTHDTAKYASGIDPQVFEQPNARPAEPAEAEIAEALDYGKTAEQHLGTPASTRG